MTKDCIVPALLAAWLAMTVGPLAAEEPARATPGVKVGSFQRYQARPATPKLLESRTLPLPRRPVQVVPIEGMDVLLLIGDGCIGRGNLPMPIGPVTIDAVEELNLLIIRAGPRY